MQLSAISNQRQLFGILAFDDVLALSEVLSLDLSLTDNLSFLEQIFLLLLELSQEATGLVVDPIYSLALLSHKPKNVGALIRLEQHQTIESQAIPQLFPNFSLLEIKNNYALAKLGFNYQSHEEQALTKKQLLAEIKDYSQSLEIDFLLKLNSNFDNQEVFLNSIQELHSFTDILVLEGISDPLLAATISSEIDIPWLLSADNQKNLSYEKFKESFRIAMENGAKGFYLGNFLWRELAQYRQTNQEFDWKAMQNFVRSTLRDRVIELSRIAEESVL
jgi:tagatose-1,6-bisphosphate aldolase